MTTVALVPMRHESERVPGKNYRLFAGRPLFHHIVETLLSCPDVDEVVIDTDSPVIREDARQSFPKVRLLERPEHLRDGRISMNEVLRHDLERVAADTYLQTHSTNPLLRSETVTEALQVFRAARHDRDSLFSVTRRQVRLWSESGHALNHDPAKLVRTQDLAPIFEENSCLYVFTAASFRACGGRVGSSPMIFEIDSLEAWDIDDETTFIAGEMLFRARARGTGEV